ncbi:unnamed protein product [Caenorhabditis bovis]|uniref:G-protein coupled receptors family 1 profile domain-containing protein n=1 Tax=Caenorhabditis bovis TaxID=2654633 RepID=A0A8S1E6C4_9PELO|nr:unnamed protein product [Caenorhabditis bovis]
MNATPAQYANAIFIASEIIVFNVIGHFGILLYCNYPSLRSKSTCLQCVLCFSQIICLLFELPNASFLLTGVQLRRNVCFPLLAVYIFANCFQGVFMLMLVIDIYIIVYLPTIYHTTKTWTYVCIISIFPCLHGTFVVTWGYLEMNDEILLFCNPPMALAPTVSEFWFSSLLVSNTINLILFIILILLFYMKIEIEKSQTRKLIKRLKVSVIVFTGSWYACMLGMFSIGFFHLSDVGASIMGGNIIIRDSTMSTDDCLSRENKIVISLGIIVANLIGDFGHINLILILCKCRNLRNKSSYLKALLGLFQMVCLLFEVPNAIFLVNDVRLKRRQCFFILLIYIFSNCFQGALMLMLVVDLYIIVYIPTWYRNAKTAFYIFTLSLFPIAIAISVLIWGYLDMNDVTLAFCNPPSGHLKSQHTSQLIRCLKVQVVIYTTTWYLCMLGVYIVTLLELSQASMDMIIANMVLLVLPSYCQSFYVIIWSSIEYRSEFLKIWRIARRTKPAQMYC